MQTELGLRPAAVALGSAVSIGGSLVTGFILGTVYAAVLIGQGVPQEQLNARLSGNTSYYVIALPIGLAFTTLGGFLAARRASSHEIPNAIATGVVCVVFGILLYTLSSSSVADVPMWYTVAGFALTLPFAWLGGVFGRRKNGTAPTS